MNLNKYLPYPDLYFALDNLRQCRLTVSIKPSSGATLVLYHAERLVANARSKYKAQMYEDKIIARRANIRAKRYASQHARRSRTMDTAAMLRAGRDTRRREARAAAISKRANNRK